MGSRQRTFVYRLDSADRIAFVDDEWVSFARENGAPTLTPEAVLGRPIWDFIADIDTAHVYSVLFQRIRQGRRVRTIPFRCDAPDRRRFMELELKILPQDRIEIRSRLLKEEPRAAVPLLTEDVARSDEWLRMCSSCKKILSPEGWVEIEEAVSRADLFAQPRLPNITHGICPACSELFFPEPNWQGLQ